MDHTPLRIWLGSDGKSTFATFLNQTKSYYNIIGDKFWGPKDNLELVWSNCQFSSNFIYQQQLCLTTCRIYIYSLCYCGFDWANYAYSKKFVVEKTLGTLCSVKIFNPGSDILISLTVLICAQYDFIYFRIIKLWCIVKVKMLRDTLLLPHFRF